jgi:hypothetical protein
MINESYRKLFCDLPKWGWVQFLTFIVPKLAGGIEGLQ